MQHKGTEFGAVGDTFGGTASDVALGKGTSSLQAS